MSAELSQHPRARRCSAAHALIGRCRRRGRTRSTPRSRTGRIVASDGPLIDRRRCSNLARRRQFRMRRAAGGRGPFVEASRAATRATHRAHGARRDVDFGRHVRRWIRAPGALAVPAHPGARQAPAQAVPRDVPGAIVKDRARVKGRSLPQTAVASPSRAPSRRGSTIAVSPCRARVRRVSGLRWALRERFS